VPVLLVLGDPEMLETTVELIVQEEE